MLPEGDLVKYSTNWHNTGIKGIVRPEDVIIASFVQLRLIAVSYPTLVPKRAPHLVVPPQAETTDIFATAKGNGSSDINYEVVLRNCNSKLTQWDESWRGEMNKGAYKMI